MGPRKDAEAVYGERRAEGRRIGCYSDRQARRCRLSGEMWSELEPMCPLSDGAAKAHLRVPVRCLV